MIFLFSCKDPNEAGIGLIPDEDLIAGDFTDTLSVHAQTIFTDSVFTDNLSQQMLGNYIDPAFGRINTSFYTQFVLSGSNIDFGTTPQLDSLVLHLDVTGFYNRFDEPLTLHIYEITDSTFDLSETYYSNDSLIVDYGNDLANGFVIDLASGTGDISVTLDSSLGNRLLNATTADLASTSAFQDFFHGLYLVTDPVANNGREAGGIFYIDLSSTISKMTLHYTDDTTSFNFDFLINNNGAFFTRVERSQTQGLLYEQVKADSTTLNPQYLLSENGAFIQYWVQMPYIDSLGLKAINKASLTFYVDPGYLGSQDRFLPPTEIFAFIADTSGKTIDNNYEVVTSAAYNASSKKYEFKITLYIQKIINGTLPNTGLVMVPLLNGITVNRAVIGGPGHATLHPEVRVTFTTLPQ